MHLTLLTTAASAAISHIECLRDVCSGFSFDLDQAHNPSWMSDIPDNVEVSSLSIPGTHNSMTDVISNHIVLQCQNTTLATQLEAGVRYIDVTAHLEQNRIDIFHAKSNTTYGLDMVLSTAYDFLDSYPTEGLILRIEKDPWADVDDWVFEDAISQYLDSDTELGQRSRSHLYVPPSADSLAPKMCDIRGKVMILQDFKTRNPGRFGMPWRSPAMKVSQWKIAKSDYIGMGAKWIVLKTSLDSAKDEMENMLHIIDASVSIGVTPSGAADGNFVHQKGVNDRLGNYLNETMDARTGVLAMDFPGKQLVNLIIARNTKLRQSS
ncbi:hypothetical protein BROUX41_005918 [Berkeleyomyces rouxiae]|uniref:uncharacterized protein n=1 Tax=Berkeleyomyces rouxiae TaxID=2035830 RepID=UPI003B7B5E4E